MASFSISLSTFFTKLGLIFRRAEMYSPLNYLSKVFSYIYPNITFISDMKELLRFLVSKEFIKQLAYVLLFLALVVFAVLTWLKSYTNHGQQLELADYTNTQLSDAMKDAEGKTFKIIVSDSTHIVGKSGGLILDQNPEPGSKVKENRKIYVTTTKYSPDQISIKDLPLLYGTDYDQAVSDLKSRFIYASIKSRKYDAGQPNHILEVWYDGRMIIDKNGIKSNVQIEKGGKMSFVISERQGGSFVIPDLHCKQVADVKSYMLYSKLKLGKIIEKGDLKDLSKAWVISQYPKANGTTQLEAGQSIDITVIAKKPKGCD